MSSMTKATKPQNELMQSAMSGDDVVAQVALVHDVMAKVMKKDEDYGIIPGGKKPSLWKPGSEKLCLTFRLSPSFTSVETYDGDHLTVKSICTLTHIPSGRIMGSGEAICSTKEKKYRLRKDGGKIVPNNDLPDLYNTMIKMSNKRSLIAAVLIVTAASSMFTQDMGEDAEKPEAEDDKHPPTPAKEIAKDRPIVETTATVKPSKEVPIVVPIKESPGTWKGVVTSVTPEELPGGKPCWTVMGADGSSFRTADAKFQEVMDGIESGHEYQIKYKPNSRGTFVIQEMKDVG